MTACEHCPLRPKAAKLTHWDYHIALVGNPNTGKSTLFNLLTGLRQHVGNWPGKTVQVKKGAIQYRGKKLLLVDLPGTYSLLTVSPEEALARAHILQERPDCVLIVADATALERNLLFALQVLLFTHRAVLALNLMDEVRRRGVRVDPKALEEELGIPVVPISARTGEGISTLLDRVLEVARGKEPQPRPLPLDPELEAALEALRKEIAEAAPGALLRVAEGDLSALPSSGRAAVLERVAPQRVALSANLRDRLAEALHRRVEELVARAWRPAEKRPRWEIVLDQILTHPILGLPVMLAGLAVIFWITIVGANYPSELLSRILLGFGEWALATSLALGIPGPLADFFWNGMYRGLVWVISVMFPPMAIFFPLFTLLEDLGILPRIAFNLDYLFRLVNAHGKQALTMAMGFACNAAGVTATRIIESPRERLIAILTNTFVPCNGRYPTLILLGMLFFSRALPVSVAAALAVAGSVLVGVLFTFLASFLLSRTLLRGTPSAFVLELPPYRKPNVLRILYTSFIDRTVLVLWRAIVMAAPAGGLTWLLVNLPSREASWAEAIARFLDPLGRAIGLDGVILLAYIIAIPANELVVPGIILLYTGAGRLTEVESLEVLRQLLVVEHGWTLRTAICLMLFAVLHNPCSTTVLTIWKETRSLRWALIGFLFPLMLAFGVTYLVARLLS